MLIPIAHEDQRVARLPWVTILLVAANVVAFLLTLPLVQEHAAKTRQRAQEIVRFAVEHPYLQLPEELAHLVPAMPPPPNKPAETIADEQARLDRLWSDLKATTSASVYRTYGYIPTEPHPLALFTSMFMHAGWLHLLGNMLFLWLSGGSLEDRWGRVFFLILYLVSGVVATLIHAAMTPHSHIPLVGASGAIAGLMGAFLVRLATTRIRFLYWIFIFRGTFEAPAYVMLPYGSSSNCLWRGPGPRVAWPSGPTSADSRWASWWPSSSGRPAWRRGCWHPPSRRRPPGPPPTG